MKTSQAYPERSIYLTKTLISIHLQAGMRIHFQNDDPEALSHHEISHHLHLSEFIETRWNNLYLKDLWIEELN